MALEQMSAFERGEDPSRVGPFRVTGPDGFPLLNSSELVAEHSAISALLDRPDGDLSVTHLPYPVVHNFGDPFRDKPHFMEFLDSVSGVEARTRLILALLERTFAYDAKISGQDTGYHFSQFFSYGAAPALMSCLADRGVHFAVVAGPLLRWFALYRIAYYGTPPVRRVLQWLEAKMPRAETLSHWHTSLVRLRGQCDDYGNAAEHINDLREAVDRLIGDGLWRVVPPCEHWTLRLTEEVEGMDDDVRGKWASLLRHCGTACSSRPSAKWLQRADSLVAGVGQRDVAAALTRWCPLIDRGRTERFINVSWESTDWQQRMHESNATVLRGLLWILPRLSCSDSARIARRIALSAYRKARGLGPRAPKVGNAAVYCLSCIGDLAAVGQLAILKVRVSFGTAQKEIEKAFDATATKLALPREEVEEMGVPAYGFDASGVREEAVGGTVCTLRVVGGEVETEWRNEKGKPVKSPPAGAKAPEHAELLKELKAAAKDAGQMLSAQRERLDRLVGVPREWAWEAFRERYLEHGLVGAVARRLIWVLDGTAVTFDGVRALDVSGGEVSAGASSRVATWHPVGRPVEEVLAWRSRLETLGVTQPFKQAHREVYLLTEAELRTRTYSNRFAAHVIRQHQFNALAAARGWKNKLRLMVDDSYPPASKELPDWGLRAEWWVEGIGEDYGTDTNDSGVFLRLATDQVRFYRTGAAQRFAHASGGGYTPTRGADPEPIPLTEVPPLAFSEVMRDVDLFVGVASVGNDPNWQDGGPNGRFRDYWHSYSFGDLAESAKTRREVLARLLPRMSRLAGKWTLLDRFLRVQGKLRAYKIHLGSGNILMEPNDQYLCIVPDSRRPEAPGYVPFEGDGTLSVVLSKALLLVEDDKITDVTITRQLMR